MGTIMLPSSLLLVAAIGHLWMCGALRADRSADRPPVFAAVPFE
jgi:hypothetical protein